MTRDDDTAALDRRPPALERVRGSALTASPTACAVMQKVYRGREMFAGPATLGMAGPDPKKLSAEEARRCFGVEQGA